MSDFNSNTMGKVPARVLKRDSSNSQANSDRRNTEADRGGDDSGGASAKMIDIVLAGCALCVLTFCIFRCAKKLLVRK